MGGWGRRLMLINPSGKSSSLSCRGSDSRPEFENVREQSLEFIWQQSCSFQRFRGEEWMPEPCRSCERRAEDFGGCRCQALSAEPATRPLRILSARWHPHITSWKQRWPKRIPAPQSRSLCRPTHSRNCSSSRVNFGATGRIPSNQPAKTKIITPEIHGVKLALHRSLPAHADRDWTHVGGGAVGRSMHETVLGVDFDATGHLARNAASDVVSKLVLAGIDEAAAERNANVRAHTPPFVEAIAGRTRNSGDRSSSFPCDGNSPDRRGCIPHRVW
jgi:radical SAM protein with 4Fe4S-binding SPASM domain